MCPSKFTPGQWKVHCGQCKVHCVECSFLFWFFYHVWFLFFSVKKKTKQTLVSAADGHVFDPILYQMWMNRLASMRREFLVSLGRSFFWHGFLVSFRTGCFVCMSSCGKQSCHLVWFLLSIDFGSCGSWISAIHVSHCSCIVSPSSFLRLAPSSLYKFLGLRFGCQFWSGLPNI